MSLQFYGYGPAFGLPDPSPFVLKSEVQLKLARVPYTLLTARPPEGPKAKIPFIQVGDMRLGDSTFIRRYIETTYNLDLETRLSTYERAQAWAIERMLEDQLYFVLLHYRWMDDANFAKGPAHFFDHLPEGAREAGRERVRAVLHGQGIGRHSAAEVAELGDRSLAALSVILGEKPYVMGERATAVDGVAFGMLAAILTPFFDGPLRQRAARYANLTAYVARMMAEVYPHFAWNTEVRAA